MKQYLTLIIFFLALGLSAQHSAPSGLRNTSPLTIQDAVLFNNVEEVILPDEYRYRSLPDSLDNSKYEWFRPIFSQTTYPNCMQSTSIAYNFTYEMCRLRNLPADNPDNQFGTHFAWNFFNGGNGWYGVNYLFTMDVLKHHGTPSVTDYGGLYAGGGQRWMSGYDEWYNAMNNRISGIRKIYVGNEEGLLTLKHWLNDHLDGSETGGVASFIACSPWNYVNIDPGLPHAGEKVILAWCPEALHGMTIVGYNDFISFDYNEDGQYTNDIDLNGDGILDMRDWEVGALKFANSYGEDWADSGFCFMMYKTLADDFEEGGIWQNTVHIVDAKEHHDTRMTFKISLEHDYRQLIRVQAGISSDPASNIPEHIHSYTIFNYQGDKHYMQGIDSLPEYKTIEFGLDVTPLLLYVTPGEEYKFFLIIDENDPQNLANGQVKRFSLMDYNDGVTEIPCDQQNVSLLENGRTLLSINYSPDFDPLLVKTQSLPLYTPGQPNVIQLEAEGGQEPYSWQLDRNYLMSENAAEFPSFDEELIIENSFEDSLAVQQLDFSFPFYGNSFDSVIVSSSGYLYFDENMYFWSYTNDLAYYLKNVRTIAPFLCDEMIINNYNDHGVWYEGDENKASFRWKTTFPELSESSSCNFAVTLYPNGNIDMYYGKVEAYQELRWVAGISNGDQCNFNLLNLPKPSLIIPGTKYELIAGEFPSYVTLSKEGNLSFMESIEASNSDVKVLVTDNTLLNTSKTFQLTDGLEMLLSLNGTEGNTISNGQTAGIDLVVQNRGSVDLHNLVFNLTCDHPLINILDSQHNLGSLAAGESIELANVFNLNCDQSMRDKQHIVLHLDMQSSTRDYQRDFYLKSKAPSVKMIEYELLSELGILEPGKTTELELRILNEGSRQADKVVAILRAEVPGITVNTNQPLNLGVVSPGNYAAASFSITPDYSIQYGTKVYLNLKLICEGGPTSESKIALWYGKTPVCVVDMDPDTTSGPQIVKLLDQMDVSREYTRSFPASFQKYQSVILCLGLNFTNHDITSPQSQIMQDYLEQGGSIYMEGRAVWEQDPYMPVFDMFNIETVTSPALYEVLDGVDSTFTEGLSYENTATQPFNFYYLGPRANAFSIFTGREYPYCAAVAYDAGTYKTIGTIFELGALISSDSCQVETFMQEVLDFFGVVESTLGIEEMPYKNYSGAMQNYPNPFSHQTKIPLVLDSKSRVEAAVYDIQGRKIYELQTPAVLESGHYVYTWDASGKDGNPVPGGIYIYRLIIDGIPHSGKMILIR